MVFCAFLGDEGVWNSTIFMAQESLKTLIQGPKLKGSLIYTVHTKNYFHILTMKEEPAIENQTSSLFLACY